MEGVLPIYKMAEGTDPDALARLWLLVESFAPVYTAQRERRVVETKKMVCDLDEVL
jgi:hypothetical protein